MNGLGAGHSKKNIILAHQRKQRLKNHILTTQQTNVKENTMEKKRKIRKTEHLNTAVLVITFTVTVVNICILALEFD
jgi:hypothetical protein